jgi:hypothetical protein
MFLHRSGQYPDSIDLLAVRHSVGFSVPLRLRLADKVYGHPNGPDSERGDALDQPAPHRRPPAGRRAEISLYREALPQASSAALAAMLLGRHTSPTQAARAERLLRVQEALNTLDPIDREVLALKHFEELSRAETAEVPGGWERV